MKKKVKAYQLKIGDYLPSTQAQVISTPQSSGSKVTIVLQYANKDTTRTATWSKHLDIAVDDKPANINFPPLKKASDASKFESEVLGTARRLFGGSLGKLFKALKEPSADEMLTSSMGKDWLKHSGASEEEARTTWKKLFPYSKNESMKESKEKIQVKDPGKSTARQYYEEFANNTLQKKIQEAIQFIAQESGCKPNIPSIKRHIAKSGAIFENFSSLIEASRPERKAIIGQVMEQLSDIETIALGLLPFQGLEIGEGKAPKALSELSLSETSLDLGFMEEGTEMRRLILRVEGLVEKCMKKKGVKTPDATTVKEGRLHEGPSGFNPMWLDFGDFFENYIEPEKDLHGSDESRIDDAPDQLVELWIEMLEDAAIKNNELEVHDGSRYEDELPFTFPNGKTYYFQIGHIDKFEEFVEPFAENLDNPKEAFTGFLKVLLKYKWMTEDPQGAYKDYIGEQ